MNQFLFSPKLSMYSRLFILLSIIGFVVGCSAGEVPSVQEGSSAVTEVVTMTPEPTEIPVITLTTPTVVATMTNEPTTTASAIPTISSSATPTITLSTTPTSVPVPTLTTIEEEALYQNLMATNGGCELPCWWGFKLGDSLENVNQRFIGLGVPWLEVGSSWKVDSDQMGTFSAGYADYYEDEQHGTVAVYRLDVNIEFHELDGSIEYIYVDVDRIKFEESQQEFIRDWKQYYLSSFLQRYGKPTQVYFRIRSIGDLMLTPEFSVSLLYREQGLAITYHIRGVWLDDQYTQAEVCFDIEDVSSLELSLFNPDGFDRWGYQFAPYHDELYEVLTWEAKFGMTLDTFYETYQHSENLNCLVLSSGSD
ncbi:MAG: hypothetical protein L0Y56_14250 [Nitrospira sp.]|nr:hypothetical protein [Nitrospira sp.]